MNWYRLNYAGEVSRAEVLRETPQFVVIKQWDKERRVSRAGEFFATFGEMKQYLCDKRLRQVKSLEDQLVYARKKLAEAEALEEKP